jgi:hypothetical protein
MAYQEIQTGLNDAIMTRIHASLDQVVSDLRCLTKLTPEQRQSTTSVGDRRFTFLSKAYRHALRHPSLMPPFRDINNYTRIFEDFQRLQGVLDRVRSLSEGLSDTVMQVGANAFDFSLVFYDMIEKAAGTGHAGTEVIYKDLAKHFARINPAEEDTNTTGGKGGDTPPIPGNIQDGLPSEAA